MRELRDSDPRTVGDYRIVARLGSGGMGEVYLGRSAAGRDVAVKLVHAAMAEDPEFRARFRREVSAARLVSGAFTAPVVGADPDAPVPWLATAYLPGLSLQQAVSQHGPLPADSVRALGAGLAEALVAIHDAGVVHRDLKPSNVLLTPEGPRVIDFGIARAADAGGALTATGFVVGTPGYMAPEQVSGEGGPAVDVFAFGSVLAYAATGAGPFGSGPPQILLYRVVHAEPELDGVADAELRELLLACLAKEPGERPGPRELLARLSPGAAEELLGTAWLPEPVAAALTRLGVPTEPAQAPKSRRAVLAGGAAGVLAIGVSVFLVNGSRRGSAVGARPSGTAVQKKTELWRAQVPLTEVTGLAVREGVLFVGGGRDGVHALDADTGSPLWSAQHAAPDGAGRVFSPLVVNGVAILRDEQNVTAVDLSKRAVVWSRRLAHYTGLDMVAVSASGLVVAAGKEELVGYEPDGDIRWTKPLDRPTGSLLKAGSTVVTTMGQLGAGVAGFAARNGKRLWQRPLSMVSGAVLAGTSVFVTADGELVCLEAGGGKVRWHRKVSAYRGSQPVVADGGVYLWDTKGNLHAHDATTGDKRWSQLLVTDVKTLGMLSSHGLEPVVRAGLAYVFDHSGNLLAMDQADGSIRWRASVDTGFALKPPVVTERAVHLYDQLAIRSFDARTGTPVREVPVPFYPTHLIAAGEVLYLAGEQTVIALPA